MKKLHTNWSSTVDSKPLGRGRHLSVSATLNLAGTVHWQHCSVVQYYSGVLEGRWHCSS